MEVLDASEHISEPQGIFYELKGKKISTVGGGV